MTDTAEAGADGRFAAPFAPFASFGPVVRWSLGRRVDAELAAPKDRPESTDAAARPGTTADAGPPAGG